MTNEKYSISNYLWEASQGNIDFLHNAAKNLREDGAKVAYIDDGKFYYVRVTKSIEDGCSRWDVEKPRLDHQWMLYATGMFPRDLDHDVLALRLGHWLKGVHEEMHKLSTTSE